MILAYFRRHRSLLAELEALRAANAKLVDDLETAQIQSWIRRRPQPRPRPEPHAFHPARPRAEEPTEVHPRAVQRWAPSK